MTNEQQPAGQPPPNWCRTCGKHRDAADAVFCSDAIHLKPKPADQGRGVGDLINRLNAEAKIWPRSDISGLLKEASAAIASITQPNAVSDEMVEAACKAAYVVPTDFARKDMRAALTAALSLPRQSEADRERSFYYHAYETAAQRHGHYETPDAEIEAALTLCRAHYPTTPQPAQADTTPAAHGVGDGMRHFGWVSIDNVRAKIAYTNLQHIADEWLKDNRLVVHETFIQAAAAPGGE